MVTRTQLSTISVRNAGDTAYILIGNITNTSLGGQTRNKIDIGSFEDTVAKTRAGRKAAGEFTLDLMMNLDDLGWKELKVLNESGDDRLYQVVMPSGTKKYIRFNAKVSNMTRNGTQNDVWRATVTFLKTSEVTRSTS